MCLGVGRRQARRPTCPRLAAAAVHVPAVRSRGGRVRGVGARPGSSAARPELARRRARARGDGEALAGRGRPAVLAPAGAAWPPRRRSVVCLVLGAWWYATGGPKGPFQVLSLRDTRGWHVESIVGSVLWVFGRGEPYREADAMRIGAVSLPARLAAARRCSPSRCGSGAGQRETAATRSARRRSRPSPPSRSARRCSRCRPRRGSCRSRRWRSRATTTNGTRPGVATVAIALTGLLAIAWRDHAAAPPGWVAWLVLVRNLVWIDIVVSWLRGPVLAGPEAPPPTHPRGGRRIPPPTAWRRCCRSTPSELSPARRPSRPPPSAPPPAARRRARPPAPSRPSRRA